MQRGPMVKRLQDLYKESIDAMARAGRGVHAWERMMQFSIISISIVCNLSPQNVEDDTHTREQLLGVLKNDYIFQGENKCPTAEENGVSILHGNALAFVKVTRQVDMYIIMIFLSSLKKASPFRCTGL